MQITFVKSLPTEWDMLGKLSGRKDLDIMPLSTELEKGIRHNQIYLKKLSPFDIILTSSLKRTKQTASVYGFQGESEPLLDELDFGSLEGCSEEELRQSCGEKWLEEPKSLQLGEAVSELEERIITFSQKYAHFNHILLFGHEVWMRAMISYAMFNHINEMNKVTVKKNACFTMFVNSK